MIVKGVQYFGVYVLYNVYIQYARACVYFWFGFNLSQIVDPFGSHLLWLMNSQWIYELCRSYFELYCMRSKKKPIKQQNENFYTRIAIGNIDVPFIVAHWRFKVFLFRYKINSIELLFFFIVVVVVGFFCVALVKVSGPIYSTRNACKSSPQW